MIQKIAIVKLTAMGDIIHTMIVLQFIKKYYPHLQIDWFVEGAFAPLLEDNQCIDTIYPLHLKEIKKDFSLIMQQYSLLKKLSKNNYDLVIDAQGLLKSALVSKILGKNVVGFDKNSIREKIASNFYTQKIAIEYSQNVIKRNIKLFGEALGFGVSDEEILSKESCLSYRDDENIGNFLSKEKENIVLIVGASWQSKKYSKEKFAQIATAIDANILIVWGNEQEKESAQYIATKSKATVMPKLDLNGLKALIAQADLVIGNDTGPTHMAWAMNRASITLFGNTPGHRNSYETAVNKILQSDSKVDPQNLDKNDFSISQIHTQEVIDLAQKLLNIKSQSE